MLGKWLEEYKKCGHTYVAPSKSQLPGYCSECGTDRKGPPIHLPEATECGHSNDKVE